jgi:hypothetical protein
MLFVMVIPKIEVSLCAVFFLHLICQKVVLL